MKKILIAAAAAAGLILLALAAFKLYPEEAPPLAGPAEPTPEIGAPPATAPAEPTETPPAESDEAPPAEPEPTEPPPLAISEPAGGEYVEPAEGPALDSAEGTPPPPAAEKCVKREPREFTVKIYGNTRADPRELEIQAGDVVTFVNEDDELHWPGADPHPTHSSLPSFDALGGISQSQSYSHTFKVVGNYGWHEHLLDDPPTIGFIYVKACVPAN